MVGISALIFAFTAPAHATETTCAFSAECFDLEACTETDFEVWFQAPNEAGDTTLTSSAEEIFAKLSKSTDGTTTNLFAIRENGDQHSLTVSKEGVGRYSVLMPSSDIALYYQGTCTAKD